VGRSEREDGYTERAYRGDYSIAGEAGRAFRHARQAGKTDMATAMVYGALAQAQENERLFEEFADGWRWIWTTAGWSRHLMYPQPAVRRG
jgi:hypothetical protein